MIVLYICFIVVVSGCLGILIGFRLKSAQPYNGVIKMVENDGRIVYTLELAGDPELLVFQKDVRFKVIPPNYEDLQDLLRDENL